jgi:hypothetical protein
MNYKRLKEELALRLVDESSFIFNFLFEPAPKPLSKLPLFAT